MKTGDKLRFTQKSLRLYTDNLWKRQVSRYHLPILSVVLDREYTPVIHKVTKKYIYQKAGRRSRLTFTVVGLALTVEWHSHKPLEERVKL